jgi:hypothetical protein
MLAHLASALLLAAAAPEGPSQHPPAVLPDRPVQEVGLMVAMEEPDAALEKRLGEAVQSVLRIAPRMHGARIVPAPPFGTCAGDCLAALGAKHHLDVLVTVTHGDNSAGISVYDVPTKREVSQESHATNATVVNNVAVAEALACVYLVPAGCKGEVATSVPRGVKLELDGVTLPDASKQSIPVGVHHLYALTKAGASRPYGIDVTREQNAPVHVTIVDGKAVFSDKPAPAKAAP